MIDQQCNTGTAARTHRQRDDHAATARIDAQADASCATIAPPFDTHRSAWQRQHFRSGQFHCSQKRQMRPIRQPVSALSA
jgi:hypothetical protein